MSQSTADCARAVARRRHRRDGRRHAPALQLTRRPAGRLLPVARRAAEVGAATAPQGVVDAVGRLRRRAGAPRSGSAGAPCSCSTRPSPWSSTWCWTASTSPRSCCAGSTSTRSRRRSTSGSRRGRPRHRQDPRPDRLRRRSIATARVDLDGVAAELDIDKVLDRVDFDRVMAQRVDLIGLAEYVVDGIDLPRIIRESTGSVASESLRGVRTRSMDADQALAALVDRMLLRRRTGRDRADQNAHEGVTRTRTGPPSATRTGRPARRPCPRRSPHSCPREVAMLIEEPAGGGEPVHAAPPGARAAALPGSTVPARAKPLQGRRAGMVTRALADTVDVAVVAGHPRRPATWASRPRASSGGAGTSPSRRRPSCSCWCSAGSPRCCT